MPGVEFNFLPTIVGSMPQTDPLAACTQIVHYLRDIPAWPQLPKKSFQENMYVQYSQGFPGVVVEEDEEKIYIDRNRGLEALERLYAAYLENDFTKYAISPEYAAGLHQFLSVTTQSPLAVKGQVTGPITWGLTVTDDTGKGILYDDFLGDAVPRLLRLKAAWQEKELSRFSKNTIIFVDEPYMSAFGSVSMMLSRDQVINLLEEVFSGIGGLKGVHCCGNTDWSLLLETSVDIISFDTYNYAQSLSLYPVELKKFLERGGTVAWGIVPNEEDLLAKETVASLKDRLEEAMAPFTRQDIRFRQLIAQGLLTPSCGLASLATEEAAARVLELLSELSETIRKRYT
ncbi:MAG: methionine synthase [Dehalococcoidales bacterium]|jgi:methionine synthase II (cobalamin-independent)|nr:methionine synthase [Dehalococcoidales bacterium]MDP6576469.1 methionine synthase [Dehalococcoidales bacterium]|tara:strand:+ start:59 stop:1090 length:1032 start_codon:yes stop_codon:yes gene_type:complete